MQLERMPWLEGEDKTELVARYSSHKSQTARASSWATNSSLCTAGTVSTPVGSLQMVGSMILFWNGLSKKLCLQLVSVVPFEMRVSLRFVSVFL